MLKTFLKTSILEILRHYRLLRIRWFSERLRGRRLRRPRRRQPRRVAEGGRQPRWKFLLQLTDREEGLRGGSPTVGSA